MTASDSDSHANCRHCGTPFPVTSGESEFCCSGCRYVYQLIHNKGLDKFYDLKDKKVPPVGTSVFHSSDLDWLIKQVNQAENNSEEEARLELEIQGISCVGCVWLIERIFREFPGGLHVHVLPNQGRIQLGWKTRQFDVNAFVREMESFGYRVGPAEGEAKRPLSPLLTRLGISAALAMNAMLFTLPFYLGMTREDPLAPLMETITFLMATGSLIAGGSYFFKRCWKSLLLKELHIDLPISIGLIAAYFGSIAGWLGGVGTLIYFDFVAIFTALMLTGRYFQERAIESNRRRLLSSSTWAQRWQTCRDGKQQPRTASELKNGDKIIMRPGQVIPVRGRLLNSSAMIGLDWITGEHQPFLARPGTSLPAGSINVSAGKTSIEALEDWGQSPLKTLMEISEQSFKPNPLLENVIRIYLSAVLAVAMLGGCLWLWSTSDWTMALQVVISVLVVSCPCALGIALPLSDELAVKTARGFGVFVRESSLWHRLSSIRTVVFDKTGTVTLETPGLSDPTSVERLDDNHRKILLDMVATSPHPASKAIREVVQKCLPHYRPDTSKTIEEFPGAGLEWVDGDDTYRVGKPSWGLRGPFPERSADCVFTLNCRPLTQFNFIEEIRTDATPEIKSLQNVGLDVVLLSGDREKNVQRMAALLGLPLDKGIGGKSPEEKAAWIQAQPEKSCLMVGDGANDSLAFDAAHCRATPAVDRKLLEQKADFYFLGKNLNGIRKTFEVAACRCRSIRHVMIFTISYNLIAIGVALAGWMSPLVAAIIMPLSSVTSLSICSIPFRNKDNKNQGRSGRATDQKTRP